MMQVVIDVFLCAISATFWLLVLVFIGLCCAELRETNANDGGENADNRYP